MAVSAIKGLRTANDLMPCFATNSSETPAVLNNSRDTPTFSPVSRRLSPPVMSVCFSLIAPILLIGIEIEIGIGVRLVDQGVFKQYVEPRVALALVPHVVCSRAFRNSRARLPLNPLGA